MSHIWISHVTNRYPSINPLRHRPSCVLGYSMRYHSHRHTHILSRARALSLSLSLSLSHTHIYTHTHIHLHTHTHTYKHTHYTRTHTHTHTHTHIHSCSYTGTRTLRPCCLFIVKYTWHLSPTHPPSLSPLSRTHTHTHKHTHTHTHKHKHTHTGILSIQCVVHSASSHSNSCSAPWRRCSRLAILRQQYLTREHTLRFGAVIHRLYGNIWKSRKFSFLVEYTRSSVRICHM